MKSIYIATPINGRQEATLAEKLAAARERIDTIEGWLPKRAQFKECDTFLSTFAVNAGKNVTTEAQAMGNCIRVLMECDAAVFDRGWHNSIGCRLEMAAARLYGKKIFIIGGTLEDGQEVINRFDLGTIEDFQANTYL